MDIIDNYNRLSLGKYLDILAIDKSEMEDLDKQVAILSILSDLPEEEILHLPITEYKEMVQRASFLQGLDDNNKHLVAKKYKIDSWELIPCTDFRKMETCQFVDFRTFAPAYDSKMAELLSTLLVPKGHRYNEGYDIIELQNALRQSMSVTEAVSLCAFFLTWSRDWIASSQNFCERELKRRGTPEMKETLKRAEMLLTGNGDGSQM